MTLNDSEEFFLTECAARARELPLPKAILFLRGMLLQCQDNQALRKFKAIYDALLESESQLDLIHSGQLKLDFEPVDPSKDGKKKRNHQ